MADIKKLIIDWIVKNERITPEEELNNDLVAFYVAEENGLSVEEVRLQLDELINDGKMRSWDEFAEE